MTSFETLEAFLEDVRNNFPSHVDAARDFLFQLEFVLQRQPADPAAYLNAEGDGFEFCWKNDKHCFIAEFSHEGHWFWRGYELDDTLHGDEVNLGTDAILNNLVCVLGREIFFR